MKTFLLFGVWAYQKTLAAWVGGHCCFYPSCSEYARLAIQKYPWYQALLLIAKRLWRCRPSRLPGVDWP